MRLHLHSNPIILSRQRLHRLLTREKKATKPPTNGKQPVASGPSACLKLPCYLALINSEVLFHLATTHHRYENGMEGTKSPHPIHLAIRASPPLPSTSTSNHPPQITTTNQDPIFYYSNPTYYFALTPSYDSSNPASMRRTSLLPTNTIPHPDDQGVVISGLSCRDSLSATSEDQQRPSDVLTTWMLVNAEVYFHQNIRLASHAHVGVAGTVTGMKARDEKGGSSGDGLWVGT
ncbi:hypothetical protein BO94DRAFT_548362 [Aspergillus sclerotioniger CBS 115572]|uniref:Uncharacterized protein n=1 Tax=Aspergillus sclerotioniger CBS 115572 TaxID=1450535 RepID=A0A317W436_9EURO|nr:hypothetical protein BO94DRAFT_548362 [Aspergillus sclerotioniger CBS 115572]PWY80371.1 hypothetical protein BO94DRAFT_548362 [Aspergillus sclerotioniger CBS 115572]